MRLSAKKSMDGTDTVVLGNDGADTWTMRFRWSSAISTRKEDYTTRLPKQGSTKLGGDGCDICVARTRGCAACGERLPEWNRGRGIAVERAYGEGGGHPGSQCGVRRQVPGEWVGCVAGGAAQRRPGPELRGWRVTVAPDGVSVGAPPPPPPGNGRRGAGGWEM